MTTTQSSSAVKQALLERLHREIVPQLERLVEELPEHLADFAEAETHLRDGVQSIARRLLSVWGQVADTKVSRPCCSRCGVPMRHRGRPETGVATTVGEVRYRRPRWRCEGCGEERYPHDEVLRFLNHNVSWPLAKVCSRLAAQIPSLEEASTTLSDDYRGVHLAKETIRTIAEAAGRMVLEQDDAQRHRVMEREDPLPESNKTPEKVYVFADGTTVHSAGDWHEIRVATVATEDAAGNPLERHSRARFLDVEDVGWTLLLLARGLGYQNAKQRAFIADGAAWLWKLQETFFGTATAILDWFHLAENVHKAANAVFGLGSAEAREWSKRIKDELWEGRVEAALNLVQPCLARARSPTKRKSLQELVTYLQNNRQHMDYPRYRDLGLPIGSGQVEAQCKTLVGARCKQAGMRNWTYAGAEAILRLRAARQDSTFDTLWDHRLMLAA